MTAGGGPRNALLARLLVGYDGSDSANAAAGFALELAAKAGAELTFVHACPDLAAAPSAALWTDVAEQAIAEELRWQRQLENLRDYVPAHVSVTCRVDRGDPAGALIAAATETGASLLLMGSHGIGRLRGAMLGSVSTQLLTHAPCSVMVFREADRPAPAGPVCNIVAGIDGSPSAAYALQLAQELAVALEARLVAAHACDSVFWFKTAPTTGMRDELRRHGRALLDEARGTLTLPPHRVDERLVEGDPREQLATICQELAPAILVLGSRGRGGFQAMLLGSTSRSLADTAPCPILVARAPKRSAGSKRP